MNCIGANVAIILLMCNFFDNYLYRLFVFVCFGAFIHLRRHLLFFDGAEYASAQLSLLGERERPHAGREELRVR